MRVFEKSVKIAEIVRFEHNQDFPLTSLHSEIYFDVSNTFIKLINISLSGNLWTNN